MTRKIFFVGLAAGIIGLALACSNSDESSSSGGNNNGTSSGASGTSGGQSSGSSGDSKFKDCNITTGTSCTEAELKPYSDCLSEKCDPGYKQCYGDDYKNGNFSGPCATWITCVQKCDCKDTPCILACKPEEACKTCVDQTSTCGDTCTEPECSKQGTPKPDGGGNNPNATCADLQTCCDSMPAGEQKDGCNNVAQSGDNANCGPVYNGLKSAGLCT